MGRHPVLLRVGSDRKHVQPTCGVLNYDSMGGGTDRTKPAGTTPFNKYQSPAQA